MELLNHILAKTNPRKTILEHSIDSASVAVSILESENFKPVFTYLYNHCSYEEKSQEEFTKWISAMIALHDIGKIDFKFQVKLDEENASSLDLLLKENIDPEMFMNLDFRHEKYGTSVIKKTLKVSYREELACIIGMHHQHPNAKHKEEMKHYPNLYAIQTDLQKNFITTISEKLNVNFEKKKLAFDNHSVWWNLFLGLLILSDWIASSNDFIVEECTNYVNASKVKALELLKKYSLTTGSPIPSYDSFTECFHISETSMRGIQKICAEKLEYGPGLTIIEAATGEGKTEAALYTAFKTCENLKKTGLYIGMPTSATSNQMYDRFKATLSGKGNIKLVHSNAWLREENAFFESEEITAAEWLSSSKRSLLCQNAVGTVDQSMYAVLRIKYSMLRFLGLLDKVVIFDEVHAYDCYMKNIVKRMLEWFRDSEIPVIMLSATLPDEVKKEYVSIYNKKYEPSNKYPLVTYASASASAIKEFSCESFKNEKIHINFMECLENYETYADAIIKSIENGGNIACICNTVEGAQRTYEAVKKISDEIPVYLFHSRYSSVDRKNIEEKIIKTFGKFKTEERPIKSIVITTQVIEQSLDIDFDYMFTEIAPIDLILQRLGRVKRFDNLIKRPTEYDGKNKKITIFTSDKSDYKKSKKVYFDLILKRTEEILTSSAIITIPDDTRKLINFVYKNSMDREHLKEWSQLYTSNTLMQLQSENSLIAHPDADELFYLNSENPVNDFCQREDDERAVTRIGTNSVKIVFVDDIKEIPDENISLPDIKNIYQKAVEVNLYGDEILTEHERGKGKLKSIVFVISKTNEIKVGKNIFVYSNEIGLAKQ